LKRRGEKGVADSAQKFDNSLKSSLAKGEGDRYLEWEKILTEEINFSKRGGTV